MLFDKEGGADVEVAGRWDDGADAPPKRASRRRRISSADTFVSLCKFCCTDNGDDVCD
jgi:hypothetical protein